MCAFKITKLTLSAGLISLLIMLKPTLVFSQEDALSSEPSDIISKNLLLDIALSGNAVLAVGERGHVIRSTNCGLTWQQIIVPTRSTLNSIFFLNDKLGWSVGHDSVILKTQDGGKNWKQIYKDSKAEQPLLDVLFISEKKGFAVGAYGALLTTQDGGGTWETGPIYGEDDFHLYRISYSMDGDLLVTGEAGSIYLSNNQGSDWHKIKSPYQGTFFGNQILTNGKLLVFGMRAHLYASEDLGQNWFQIQLPMDTSLEDSLITKTGEIVIVGASGVVMKGNDNGKHFTILPQANKSHLAGLIQCGGKILSVGEKGVQQVIE